MTVTIEHLDQQRRGCAAFYHQQQKIVVIDLLKWKSPQLKLLNWDQCSKWEQSEPRKGIHWLHLFFDSPEFLFFRLRIDKQNVDRYEALLRADPAACSQAQHV